MVSSHKTLWYFLLPFQCQSLTMTRDVPNALRIFILVLAPKSPDCFLWPVKHATIQLCPPLRHGGLLFTPVPPLCPATQSSFLFFRHTDLDPPGSLSHLSPKAKPHLPICPAARLPVLTSGFPFFPNGKAWLSDTPALMICLLRVRLLSLT